ncbi:MAG: branched-chain amino acid ABC transporter permease [Reyranellaceae bacterium]
MDIGIEGIVGAVIRGVGIGSIYSLIAHGYNVIYSGTNVVNFAQGATLMFAIYIGAWLLGPLGIAVPIVILLVMAAMALIGFAEERLAVRPVQKHGQAMLWITSTLGLSVLIDSIAVLLWGPLTIPFPALVREEGIQLGPLSVSPVFSLIIAMNVAIGVGLTWFYRSTRTGRALLAVSQDRDAAALRGINPSLYSLIAFGISGALMGLAGMLVGQFIFADTALSLTFGVKGFIVAALGGLGSTRGAVIGGWILGVVEALGVLITDVAYRDVIALVVFLLVLFARPQGLFGFYNSREV